MQGRKNTFAPDRLLSEFKAGRKDFSGIVLANESLDGFDLGGIVLRKADLSYSSFTGVNLGGADLSGADMTWTKLRLTDLRKAKLRGAVMRWALLDRCFLDGADMSGADMSWSKIENTNIASANLEGAKINWVSLRSVTVSSSQIPQTVMQTLKTESVATPEGRRIDAPEDERSAAYGEKSGGSVPAYETGAGGAYTAIVSGTLEYGREGAYTAGRKKRDVYGR